LRKISLKRLEAALAAAVKDRKPLPDEMRLLGGLQRIEYVFAYPEQNDVVLAGPGEGWRVDGSGYVVGVTTGRPTLLLDDLLVALRCVQEAREKGITCSIEPTAEGRRRFELFMRRQRRFSPAVVDGIAKSLGPQQVLITGVPPTSHFARVMLAGDYRMKRIAMQLDESPESALPSYLALLRSTRSRDRNVMPRWWLACDFEPLACSPDGLAWQIRGRGVKAVTEDDLIAADGSAVETGRTNPVAQEWADRMNACYDRLAVKEPVFGQLRNLMDLCLVAALISRHRLLERSGCSLPLLTQPDSPFRVVEFPEPKSLATRCSVVKRGTDWIITASGGVDMDGWRFAEQWQSGEEPAKIRLQAKPDADDAWCWN
jgi:hypothetical protein